MDQERVYPKAILGPLKDMIIEDLRKSLADISSKYGVEINIDDPFPCVGEAHTRPIWI